MSTIVITDLAEIKDLDKEALIRLIGGKFIILPLPRWPGNHIIDPGFTPRFPNSNIRPAWPGSGHHPVLPVWPPHRRPGIQLL